MCNDTTGCEVLTITVGELHGNREAMERWLAEEFAPAIRKARHENPDPDPDAPGPDGLRR